MRGVREQCEKRGRGGGKKGRTYPQPAPGLPSPVPPTPSLSPLPPSSPPLPSYPPPPPLRLPLSLQDPHPNPASSSPPHSLTFGWLGRVTRMVIRTGRVTRTGDSDG